MEKLWLLGRTAVKWINGFIIDFFSCSPTHLSTCLSPFSRVITGSSFCSTQIYSFFASLSLVRASTLPQIKYKKCLVCCSLTQLDMHLWGALLLPPSIYYYIIVIITENSTWLSYKFTLFTLFPTHPFFNLPFLCIVSHSCARWAHFFFSIFLTKSCFLVCGRKKLSVLVHKCFIMDVRLDNGQS